MIWLTKEPTNENWTAHWRLTVCRCGSVRDFAFLIMFGAAIVLFLETPVMMALTAIALGVAVWMVGKAVTRQGFISGRYSEEVSMCESVDLVPVLEPEIVAMNEVLADGPTAAVTASITNVFGPCPFGLMPGNTWHISADGKLSRPMCLTGATP